MKRKLLLFLIIVLVSTFNLLSQNEPVMLEAESGTIGSDFTTGTDGDITFVSITTNSIAQFPESANRVITYEVTFPEAGNYALFARVRVGSGAADDDSFFYGVGFGSKTVDDANDWITVNQLVQAGYTVLTDVVDGKGGAPSQVWKWVKLSGFDSGDGTYTYTVSEGALTQTLQIGAREDGLEIDAFAFGKDELYFTVDQLNKGEAGSVNPPGVEPIGPPLADSLDKFLGCAFGPDSRKDFEGYWNQITPGNASKWGTVEYTRDNMNWSELDEAYALAMENNFPFKLHTMIWGSQQPEWVKTLSTADQRSEIEEWYDTIAARYDTVHFVDVVNEPLHAPPDNDGNGAGNYIEALGGAGASGWEWVLESFRLARGVFSDTTELLINEYNILSSATNTKSYLEIIKLLQAENLIDGIGLQGHAFSTRGSITDMIKNVDSLATTGLPIYITELDIDGPTDAIQLQDYQRIFPPLWEHPSIKGITLWGFRPGMWRSEQMAYIIDGSGNERPAMTWLRAYLKDEYVKISDITLSAQGGTTAISVDNGTLQILADLKPDTATLDVVEWSVSDESIATISSSGLLTAKANGTVRVIASAMDYNSTVQDEISITISNQIVGINDIEPEPEVSIYPNPLTGNRLILEGADAYNSIQIFDLQGRLHYENQTGNVSKLSLHLELTPGVYLIHLKSNQNTSLHKKLIIK